MQLTFRRHYDSIHSTTDLFVPELSPLRPGVTLRPSSSKKEVHSLSSLNELNHPLDSRVEEIAQEAERSYFER